MTLETHARSISEKLVGLEVTIVEAIRAVTERKEYAMQQLDPWMSKRDAARHLAMSISTIETRLTSHNPPPHMHNGGKLRFKPSELDEWLRQWAVVRPRRGYSEYLRREAALGSRADFERVLAKVPKVPAEPYDALE